MKASTGADDVEQRQITVNGRTYKAEVAAKSLRRCIAAINAAPGDDSVVVVVQGKFDGSFITEAGIVAQPKAPKPAVTE